MYTDRLGHERDHVGLGDRLTLADGERRVVVRPRAEGRGNEAVTGDVADGGQHRGIVDAARLELLDDHPLPLALEA